MRDMPYSDSSAPQPAPIELGPVHLDKRATEQKHLHRRAHRCAREQADGARVF